MPDCSALLASTTLSGRLRSSCDDVIAPWSVSQCVPYMAANPNPTRVYTCPLRVRIVTLPSRAHTELTASGDSTATHPVPMGDATPTFVRTNSSPDVVTIHAAQMVSAKSVIISWPELPATWNGHMGTEIQCTSSLVTCEMFVL